MERVSLRTQMEKHGKVNSKMVNPILVRVCIFILIVQNMKENGSMVNEIIRVH